MGVRAEAFLAIEQSLSTRLQKAWEREAVRAWGEIAPMLKRGEWEDAIKVAEAIDLAPVFDKNREYIRASMYSAMLFGASRLTDELKASAVTRGAFDSTIDDVLRAIRASITGSVQEQVVDDLVQYIHEEWRAAESVQKFDPDQPREVTTKANTDLGVPRLSVPLVSFKKVGDAMLQMVSSLNTSRVASFGYTAEAGVLGVTRYAVSEQLDNRICPVCEVMHGRTFNVADARDSLTDILNVKDPADLASLQPWPSQSKAAVAELEAMTEEEIVARNWHIPPYHPNCRGILVHVARVPPLDKDVPLEGAMPVPPDQYVATLQSFREYGIPIDESGLSLWNAMVGVELGAVLSGFMGKPAKQIMDEVLTGSGAYRSIESGLSKFELVDDLGTVDIKLSGQLFGTADAMSSEFSFNVGQGTMTLDKLVLAETDAAAGAMNKVLSSWAPAWDRLGIDEITLVTGTDLGAVAWAKYGFLPSVDEWDTLRKTMAARLEKIEGFSEANRKVAQSLLDQKDPKGMWALMDLDEKAGGFSLGEKLIEGYSWNATLDLTDPEAKNRLRVLLGAVVKAEWDESEHPRDEDGKFTDSGGGSRAGAEAGGKIDQAHDRAAAHVLGQKNSANQEYGSAFGQDGEHLANWVGTANEVDLTKGDWEAVAGTGATFYHNHPSGYSLSHEDFTMNAAMGLFGTYAVTQDGSTFRADTRDLYSEYKEWPQEVYDAFTEHYSQVQSNTRWAAKEMVLKQVLEAAVDLGRITTEQGNIWFSHAINVVLDRVGVHDYRMEKEGKLMKDAREAVDKAVGIEGLLKDAVKAAKSVLKKDDRAVMMPRKKLEKLLQLWHNCPSCQ